MKVAAMLGSAWSHGVLGCGLLVDLTCPNPIVSLVLIDILWHRYLRWRCVNGKLRRKGLEDAVQRELDHLDTVLSFCRFWRGMRIRLLLC